MANESWVTGKKYRILTDLANKKWSIISFINKAADTIFNDNKSAETKLGAINGITSDLNGENETIAASIKAVHELNSSLGGNNLIYNESEDAYYIQHGADAALKKLGSGTLKKKIVLEHTRFTGSTTVNIANQLSNYKDLTVDNFYINTINANVHDITGFVFGYNGMGFSYNPVTGILTVKTPNIIYEMSVVAVYVE